MENQVNEVATGFINSAVWELSLLFIVSYIVIGIIKSTATSIFSYILVKSDIYGLGSYVDYKGSRYIIRDIGLRRIKLETVDFTETRYISTLDWKSMELVIPDHLRGKK